MGALKVRINDVWETVAAPAEPSLDEVWVGSSSPDPALPYQIWYDTSTEPGVLRVKRENGVWETVDVTATSEVSVSATDPYDADPQATDELWFDTTTMTLWYREALPTPHWRPTADIPANEVFVGLTEPTPDVELWYDPDAVATLGPSEIPPGGLTHQALTKRTDQDGEVEWSGPHLKLAGGVMTGPIDMNGSDIDRSGNVDFNGGKKIQFPNEADVAKINLYADTFGLGIESGTTTIFGSSRVRFRVGTPADAARGGITSPVVAEFEASGLGPRTNTNVSWQNSFTGSAQFRVNPAMVTLALWNFTNGVELTGYNPIKMFDYPAGVPAPWMNCSGAVMPVWMGSTYGYLPLRIDCRTDGVFCYTPDYFDVGDLYQCACTVTWAR